MSKELIHVVAAVIYDRQQIVLAKRPDHVHKGGLWEFPGGKLEPGEQPEHALRRELEEELGITPVEYHSLIQIPHHYPDKSVLLDVWVVTRWQGDLHGREDQPVIRVQPQQLKDYDFPEANLPIITASQLPEHYLITPDIQTSPASFIKQLKVALDQGIQLLQFRQTQLDEIVFNELATQVIDVCHQQGCRVMLNSEPEKILQLGADGVHLNSHRLMSCQERPLPSEYWVASSCHSKDQIQHSIEIQADFAVLGAVQATQSHPGKPPLGWIKFEELVAVATLPVYALGGMDRQDVVNARRHGGQGVAAIRSLWQE